MSLGISFAAGVFGLYIVQLSMYVRDILMGQTRPHLFSQLAWAILGSIAAAAQFAGGFSWSLVLPSVIVLGNLVIVGLCLLGYGYKNITLFDYVSFALAIVAIVLWKVTQIPLFALILSIGALVLAGLPTYTKTFLHPESEHRYAWLLLALIAIMSLITVEDLSFNNLAYSLYVLFEAILVTGLTYRNVR